MNDAVLDDSIASEDARPTDEVIRPADGDSDRRACQRGEGLATVQRGRVRRRPHDGVPAQQVSQLADGQVREHGVVGREERDALPPVDLSEQPRPLQRVERFVEPENGERLGEEARKGEGSGRPIQSALLSL